MWRSASLTVTMSKRDCAHRRTSSTKNFSCAANRSGSKAKAAVLSLSRLVADVYAKDGIRCNCVAPAVTETPLMESRLKDAAVRTAMEARVPLGRLGSPDDVAQAALYLASDDATWTTGTILTVDGGIMAQ